MKTTGKEIRLGRFIPAGQNVVITALDHGAQMGAIPGVVDLPQAVEKIAYSDGILVTPEVIPDLRHVFAAKKAPTLLVRVTWTTAYCFEWKYNEGHTTQVIPVEKAFSRGADIVTACCVLQSGCQQVDRDNIRIFSDIAGQADECGVPLLGEAYPLGADFMPQKKLHKLIAASCRILWEMGADIIKTFYTGPDFAEIAESVKVPIVVLGAAKRNELSALQMAESAIAAGARGVAFGRNVFQAADPSAFLRGLKDVVNKKAGAKEAALKYKLGKT